MNNKLSPFQQGSLDGLCGIYSIVNSIHALHGPLSLSTAEELFIEVIQQLEEQANSALIRLEDGTTLPELSKGLRSACNRFPIRWSRPFHMMKHISLDGYWQHAQRFIDTRQGVFIINVIKQDRYDHWTLAHRITDKSLFLFDSDGMKRLHRRHCTVNKEDEANLIYLNPRASFFIWREQSHQGAKP